MTAELPDDLTFLPESARPRVDRYLRQVGAETLLGFEGTSEQAVFISGVAQGSALRDLRETVSDAAALRAVKPYWDEVHAATE